MHIMGSSDAQRLPSSKLKVKMVYFCQVDGCKIKLSNCKPYCMRYRVCPAHLAASQCVLQGAPSRFCQQCGKFHSIQEFDGNKRSCRIRLMHHNNSRQQRRKEAALQHSMTTSMMLQHTGVRAAPGRRSSQPLAEATAAGDAAAAATAAGREPASTHGDVSKQHADCSNSDRSSSECKAHHNPGQQQCGNDSNTSPTSTGSPLAPEHLEVSATGADTPRTSTSNLQQQQQRANAVGDAGDVASDVWDLFANQGPYTGAAACGVAAGALCTPLGNIAGSGAAHSYEQQQQQPQTPASAAAANASWASLMPAGSTSLTAMLSNAASANMSAAAAAAAAQAVWPSPISSSTPQKLQQAHLAPLAAAATSAYYGSSSSPANLPASACIAGVAGQGQASAAALDAGTRSAAAVMMTPFASANSYQSAEQQHYAVQSPAAAAAATATCSYAVQAGVGVGPCAAGIGSADAGGFDHGYSSAMQRVFSRSMSSGGSYSCMPLHPAAAAAAAYSLPAFADHGWTRPGSFTASTSNIAAAADALPTCTAAAASYIPAAAAVAGVAGGFDPSTMLDAAGVNLRSLCTVPGCTKCPPHTRIGPTHAAAWLDPAAAAAAAAAAGGDSGGSGDSMAYRGSGGLGTGPGAAAGPGYAMQPAVSANLPASMPMEWQAGVHDAGTTAAAGTDAARLFERAEQQAEHRRQSQLQHQALTQVSAAAMSEQYSQQYSQNRQYPDRMYSSAASSAVAAAALAAAGSLELPSAATSAGRREELAGIAAKPVTSGNGYGLHAASAAVHCDVWSCLDTTQQQQQQQQPQLRSCSSYNGATAHATAPCSHSARRASYTGPGCSALPDAAAAAAGPSVAAPGSLEHRWPALSQPHGDAAFAAAAAGGEDILYGHPERPAAGVQAAACFTTMTSINSSNQGILSSIPGLPISAEVLSGLPVAPLAVCELPCSSYTAAGLQGRLLAQMSTAAGAAAAAQQQMECQFPAGMPQQVTFAAAPEQLQLQPSTPQNAKYATTAPGTCCPAHLTSVAAAPPGNSSNAGSGAYADPPATGAMWQPPLQGAALFAAAAIAPAAQGEPLLLLTSPAQLADGSTAAAAAAAVGGYNDAADGGGGVGCVRGAGDSFGGFCDELLGSCKGLAELLHTWGAEGDAEELESMALLPDDGDML